MTLNGMVSTAEDNTKGFDCNQVLSDRQIAEFVANDYKFVIRYIPRLSPASIDLTTNEAERILKGGLGLGIVQHVSRPQWLAFGDKGRLFGNVAAREANEIGFPKGITVWLDLEEVDPGVHPQDIIEYCREWYDVVNEAGYNPGLYCGYGTGLTGKQLYNLPFRSYWKAYNLNKDEYPLPRGFQIKQDVEQVIANVRFDPDTTQSDSNGDRAWFLWP